MHRTEQKNTSEFYHVSIPSSVTFFFSTEKQITFPSQRHTAAPDCQATSHFLHHQGLAKSAANSTIH